MPRYVAFGATVKSSCGTRGIWHQLVISGTTAIGGIRRAVNRLAAAELGVFVFDQRSHQKRLAPPAVFRLGNDQTAPCCFDIYGRPDGSIHVSQSWGIVVRREFISALAARRGWPRGRLPRC